jgi:hypothetical protein
MPPLTRIMPGEEDLAVAVHDASHAAAADRVQKFFPTSGP